MSQDPNEEEGYSQFYRSLGRQDANVNYLGRSPAPEPPVDMRGVDMNPPPDYEPAPEKSDSKADEYQNDQIGFGVEPDEYQNDQIGFRPEDDRETRDSFQPGSTPHLAPSEQPTGGYASGYRAGGTAEQDAPNHRNENYWRIRGENEAKNRAIAGMWKMRDQAYKAGIKLEGTDLPEEIAGKLRAAGIEPLGDQRSQDQFNQDAAKGLTGPGWGVAQSARPSQIPPGRQRQQPGMQQPRQQRPQPPEQQWSTPDDPVKKNKIGEMDKTISLIRDNPSLTPERKSQVIRGIRQQQRSIDPEGRYDSSRPQVSQTKGEKQWAENSFPTRNGGEGVWDARGIPHFTPPPKAQDKNHWNPDSGESIQDWFDKRIAIIDGVKHFVGPDGKPTPINKDVQDKKDKAEEKKREWDQKQGEAHRKHYDDAFKRLGGGTTDSEGKAVLPKEDDLFKETQREARSAFAMKNGLDHIPGADASENPKASKSQQEIREAFKRAHAGNDDDAAKALGVMSVLDRKGQKNWTTKENQQFLDAREKAAKHLPERPEMTGQSWGGALQQGLRQGISTSAGVRLGALQDRLRGMVQQPGGK